MKISVDLAPLSETRWTDYAVRFLFGGLASLRPRESLLKSFGPVVGGLFLAFPAIFPASATLLEKQEINRKERLGLNSRRRAAATVSVDAAGSRHGQHRPDRLCAGSVETHVFALAVDRAERRDDRLGGYFRIGLGRAQKTVKRANLAA